MAERRRRQRPYSRDKLVKSLASIYAARMGPLANSPLGEFIVMSAALQSASKWYHKRSIATAIYRDALAELGAIPAMDRIKVNALASAASRAIVDAMERLPNKPISELLDVTLKAVNARAGAPETYVEAVKKAALARVGQIAHGSS